MSDVIIREVPAGEIDVDLQGLQEEGLTVLPLRRTEDGRGVYGNSHAAVVKEARADGVEVEFRDKPENRAFEAKYGFMTDVAVPYLFGVSSSGGWAGLAVLVRKLRGHAKGGQVRVITVEAGSGRSWSFEGSVDAVSKAIKSLDPGSRDDHDGA